MQLLKCLRISPVRESSGTVCKPTHLVYHSSPRLYIDTRPEIPFLGLYNQSKNLEFLTQLQFLKLCFYGTTASCQSHATTKQATGRRAARRGLSDNKTWKAGRRRNQSHRAERERSKSAPQTATECPITEEKDERYFRCVYSAAREQGLVCDKNLRDRKKCDKMREKILQRLKDYELGHWKCHNWDKDRRRLPNDPGIGDYTEEDNWYRLLLKAFPCYFYNGMPLPNPYTRWHPDLQIPHVSRYDPESLGLKETELIPLLAEIQSIAATGTISISQPMIAQALYRIFPEGSHTADDESLASTILIQSHVQQTSLIDEDSEISISRLSPNTQPTSQHSPSTEEFADFTSSGDRVYGIDPSQLIQNPQPRISHSPQTEALRNRVVTMEPGEPSYDPGVFSVDTVSNTSMIYTNYFERPPVDNSTAPTSLRSGAPLSTINLCRCPVTTDINNLHYYCAHQYKCDCASCGRWMLGSPQGNRILNNLITQAERSKNIMAVDH